MQTHPSLSIIIPCFGHSVELEACLHALEAQRTDTDFEVIVVDSAFDPRVEATAALFPRARLLRSERHLFPGAARNLGVRNATSENLAFLDADCIPSRDWVRTAHLSIHAGQAITGGSILNHQPVRAIQWSDNQLQFADFRPGRAPERGAHFPSCNLVMSRTIFDRLGGFREDVMTGEDALFSARAIETLSDELWFNPDMAVSHHGRESLCSLVQHQYFLGQHRARLRLAFTRAWALFARSPLLGGPALLWRYGYVGLRTWQYSNNDMMRFVLHTPILFLGLLAWTAGFYHGVSLYNRGDRA